MWDSRMKSKPNHCECMCNRFIESKTNLNFMQSQGREKKTKFRNERVDIGSSDLYCLIFFLLQFDFLIFEWSFDDGDDDWDDYSRYCFLMSCDDVFVENFIH